MLPATAVALAVLAVLLAWPVPALLARGRWAGRDPLVALVCWQALGLAGGLSMIGALLVHGLAPWGSSLPAAAWALATGRATADPVRGDQWVTLTLAGVLAFELVGVLVLSWLRTTRTRRRHRALLELLVRPAAAHPAAGPEARLLDHPAPVAFCIPGARPLLVLSSGIVAELDDDQLAAVVAHERAHLREHHHLLLLPFVAWEAALPVLPAAARAHAAVRELVEMRADDAALRTLSGPAPRRTLAQAIVAAAGGAGGSGVPDGALAVTGGGLRARVLRLLEPPHPLSPAGRWSALVAAGLLLLLPTVLLLVPSV